VVGRPLRVREWDCRALEVAPRTGWCRWATER
jgi:hypothetical protein